MDISDISLIQTILDGSNYFLWAQAMSSFLRACKLWRYVTGDITEPNKGEDDKFFERFEDWDSKNHQIITCFRKTSTMTINIHFGRFETAKSVWDFLANRYVTADLSYQYRLLINPKCYTTADLTRQYQLLSDLHCMHQEAGQSIHSFLSQMYAIWDQLTLSEPTWVCPQDAEKFTIYRDEQRLAPLLMALNDDFKHVRVSLLHQNPLPTLDNAVIELLSEETRLGTFKSQHTDAVVANYYPRDNSSTSITKKFCKYCHKTGHVLLDCPTRFCKFCQQVRSGHYLSECPSNPNRQPHNNRSRGFQSKLGAPFKSKNASQSAASIADDSPVQDSSSLSISVSDLEAILKQVLSNSSAHPSTALSITSGELLTTKEARRRQHMYDELSSGGRFSSALLVVREHLPSGKACLRMNIDATRVGNVARFINHSCDGGNLLTMLMRSSGALLPRLCCFASRDIQEDEELSFSYGDTRLTLNGLHCFCGSPNCFGILPSECT